MKKYTIQEVEEYVSQFYYTREEIENVAHSIKNGINNNRLDFAITKDMDLYELERWDYTCLLNEEGKLYSILEKIDFKIDQNVLNEILLDGERFMDEISGPLWENNYEIFELENY